MRFFVAHIGLLAALAGSARSFPSPMLNDPEKSNDPEMLKDPEVPNDPKPLPIVTLQTTADTHGHSVSVVVDGTPMKLSLSTMFPHIMAFTTAIKNWPENEGRSRLQAEDSSVGFRGAWAAEKEFADHLRIAWKETTKPIRFAPILQEDPTKDLGITVDVGVGMVKRADTHYGARHYEYYKPFGETQLIDSKTSSNGWDLMPADGFLGLAHYCHNGNWQESHPVLFDVLGRNFFMDLTHKGTGYIQFAKDASYRFHGLEGKYAKMDESDLSWSHFEGGARIAGRTVGRAAGNAEESLVWSDRITYVGLALFHDFMQVPKKQLKDWLALVEEVTKIPALGRHGTKARYANPCHLPLPDMVIDTEASTTPITVYGRTLRLGKVGGSESLCYIAAKPGYDSRLELGRPWFESTTGHFRGCPAEVTFWQSSQKWYSKLRTKAISLGADPESLPGLY